MTSSATIRAADAVVRRRRPALNSAARQIALAIGLLETGFGVDGSWVDPETDLPSYNWGGLVGTGPAGKLTHGDRNPDGSPTTYGFKMFHSMDEAFDAFFATWSRGDLKGVGHPEVPHEPTVLPAAARGDARSVARTMYAHGYYGGVAGDADARIEAYAKAINGAAGTVSSAIGEPKRVSLVDAPTGAISGAASSKILAATGAAGLGYSISYALKAPLFVSVFVATALGGAMYYYLRKRAM